MTETTAQASDASPRGAGAQCGVEALTDALRSEMRLLEALVQVLRRQRTGVAQDDLETVDESVYSAQRILLTLAEAGRRRRSLMEIVAGTDDVPVAHLDEVLGDSMTSPLSRAQDELVTAARRLAAELDMNRRVLQSAIRTGESYVRALYGTTEGVLYSPGAEAGSTYNSGDVLRRV